MEKFPKKNFGICPSFHLKNEFMDSFDDIRADGFDSEGRLIQKKEKRVSRKLITFFSE